jgi:hypothetical protein
MLKDVFQIEKKKDWKGKKKQKEREKKTLFQLIVSYEEGYSKIPFFFSFLLTCQIHDLRHKTWITSQKANRNKSWSLIFDPLNIEEWNWKNKPIRMKKNSRVNRVNLSNLRFGLWDWDNLIKSKLKKKEV